MTGTTTLAERVKELDWYHTFEFPDGTVTRGFFDTRGVVPKLPIPDSLAGKRCLDVAAADGFFSIEMARRGGDVVSLDLADTTRQDWQGPPGVNDARRAGTGRANRAFELASAEFGVKADRRDLSIYDISPDELGTFDYVFMGNILLHLSDPSRGLHAVRSVLGPGAELLSFEGISLPLTILRPFTPAAELWRHDEPSWWQHNQRGHRRLIEAGGFRLVAASRVPFFVPLGDFHRRWPTSIPKQAGEWYFWLFIRRIGGASSWIRAVPRPLG